MILVLCRSAWKAGIWALCFTAWSCAGGEEGDAARPESPFFDLQEYFEKEVERLQARQPGVAKTVTFGGKTEEQRFDSLDFREELKVFLDADINRVAWWDRYSIDSVRTSGALRSIRYAALDPNLKIRSVVLDFTADSLSKVAIKLFSDSPASRFSQELIYRPGDGYRIETQQKVVLSKPEDLLVDARFLP